MKDAKKRLKRPGMLALAWPLSEAESLSMPINLLQVRFEKYMYVVQRVLSHPQLNSPDTFRGKVLLSYMKRLLAPMDCSQWIRMAQGNLSILVAGDRCVNACPKPCATAAVPFNQENSNWDVTTCIGKNSVYHLGFKVCTRMVNWGRSC